MSLGVAAMECGVCNNSIYNITKLFAWGEGDSGDYERRRAEVLVD